MKGSRAVPFHLTTIVTTGPAVLALLVFLFISLLTRQTQMTLLIGLILGVTGIANIWSRLAFEALSIKTRVNRTRVFPNESVRFDIQVENRKFLPLWIEVDIEADGKGLISVSRDRQRDFLLWFKQTGFALDLIAQKRGCYTVDMSRVIVSDLFRFYPRQQARHYVTQVVVFPCIFPIRSVLLPENWFFGRPGTRSPIQDPVYVLGTRDYQSFTPTRQIHWKASARFLRLKEKVCEPSVMEKTLVVLDVGLFWSQEASSDFETMLEAVASLVVHYSGRGHAVGFLTNAGIKQGNSGFIPLRRNKGNLGLILETLARAEMKPQNRIRDRLQRHVSSMWGIGCIFCTHHLDESMMEIARLFAARRIPVRYLVSDQASVPAYFGSESIFCVEDIRI